jgi:hypothetical protein
MPSPYLPLFSLACLVEDLLSGYILKDRPEFDELDFDQMTLVPDDWVPDGPRYADLMWSIPFRTVHSATQATHLMLLLKFASTVVSDAGARLDRHAASLLREIGRRRAFGAPATPPLVMPVVIYDGDEPWNAPDAIRVP